MGKESKLSNHLYKLIENCTYSVLGKAFCGHSYLMDKRILLLHSSQTCCEILKSSSMGDFVMRLLLSSEISGIALNQMIHASPKPLRHPLMEFAGCSSTTASDASSSSFESEHQSFHQGRCNSPSQITWFSPGLHCLEARSERRGIRLRETKAFILLFALILPYDDY